MAITGQRRSGDRVLGTWDGRCRARSGMRWGDCIIIDLSLGGAGVLVPPGAAPIEDRLEVDIRTVLGRRRAMVLGGSVRDVSTLPDGWHRVALQFSGMRRGARRKLGRVLDRWH